MKDDLKYILAGFVAGIALTILSEPRKPSPIIDYPSPEYEYVRVESFEEYDRRERIKLGRQVELYTDIPNIPFEELDLNEPAHIAYLTYLVEYPPRTLVDNEEGWAEWKKIKDILELKKTEDNPLFYRNH